jgi:tricorn protease-like protein
MILTLVGVSHRTLEEKLLVKDLAEGDEVFLIRDPENEYDSNAIKVIDADNNHLGFITSKEAKELAPLLDDDARNDETYRATIFSKRTPLSAQIEFNHFD